MRSGDKGSNWRLGYGVFCLVYTIWVVYLGLDNFDKVHGEYRRVLEDLRPVQVENIARQELVGECRREARRSGRTRAAGSAVANASEELCRTFPETVLEKREKDVVANLLAEKKRFRRKLVVFYGTFGVFFVALPLSCLYLLLSFLIWIFRDLKFVK
ncbi:MAG: hypothetical protein ACYC9M_05300 [Desulfobulbaceae bacterium]